MGLRTALRDHHRHEGHARRFPGERRTTRGLFAGDAGRLVHVGPDGRRRDFGYPLSRLSGLAEARLGIAHDGDVRWLEDGAQRYHGDTTLVVTEHDIDDGGLTTYDLTVDGTHTTHVAWPDAPDDARLVGQFAFEPDGREDRVGQLDHGDAVELFHASEHDYLASATGLTAEGRIDRLGDIAAGQDPDAPAGRYEETHLTGTVRVEAPFEAGTATVATLVTGDADRESDLERVRAAAARDAVDLRAAARDTAPAVAETTGGSLPVADCVAADLRVLSLLSAPSGRRVAGPDFDPFYAHSGGYGYTWFRDDAEISRFLLAADRRLDLGLDDWHARSARGYVESQLDDGTWPHRVWPADGGLAPGWAHARIEAGDDVAYQADQTASVVAFLAEYLPDAPADLCAPLVAALDAALDGLDASLAADGRPETCQNAWENMDGRFTHTAATFLHAYSAAAECPALAADRRAHAREQATRVYEGLDALWRGDRYALRERPDGTTDDRLDSATFALAGAFRAYDAAVGVDAERLDRLVTHVATTVDGLDRETDALSGLFRFEGDDWRQRDQGREKVWTVSTGWGASACSELASLLAAHGDDRAAAAERRARELLAPLLPGGALCTAGDYLPEQFFDDGTPDSATPLGWPHAIRLATVAALAATDAPAVEAPANDD
jgi:hypothetical protein